MGNIVNMIGIESLVDELYLFRFPSMDVWYDKNFKPFSEEDCRKDFFNTSCEEGYKILLSANEEMYREVLKSVKKKFNIFCEDKVEEAIEHESAHAEAIKRVYKGKVEKIMIFYGVSFISLPQDATGIAPCCIFGTLGKYKPTFEEEREISLAPKEPSEGDLRDIEKARRTLESIAK